MSPNKRWRVNNIIAEPIREMKIRNTEAELDERMSELLKIARVFRRRTAKVLTRVL